MLARSNTILSRLYSSGKCAQATKWIAECSPQSHMCAHLHCSQSVHARKDYCDLLCEQGDGTAAAC